MATNNPKNQLALDLGDTTAKLTVRDLVVRGEIETPRASARKPRPVPTFERALVDGAVPSAAGAAPSPSCSCFSPRRGRPT